MAPMTMLRSMGAFACLPLLLAACDGGNLASLSGTSAVGAPLAASIVELRCNNGRQVSARTSEDGRWAAVVPGEDLPCAVRVTAADGQNAFFAVAEPVDGAQTVNITPLTSLVVAQAIGTDPTAAWFTALDDTARDALAAALPAAVIAVSQSLRNAGYGVPADFDPLRDALQARPGDVHDGWLEAFAYAAAGSGLSYSQITAQYAATGNLPIGTDGTEIAVWGSWSVTGRDGRSRTLVPSPGWFWMMADSQRNLTGLGFRHVSTGLVNGMPLARVESVNVELDAQGRNQWVNYMQGNAGTPMTISACEWCPGVSVTRRAGGVITLRMTNVRMGDYVLNGSVSARAPRAVWRPRDLPRTSTGSLTFNGELREFLGADVRMPPDVSANAEVTLDFEDHQPMTIWQYAVEEPVEGASPFGYQGGIGYFNEWLELVGSILLCEVQADCGVTIAPDGDGVLLTLDGAVFRDTSTGAQSRVSGSIHVQPDYGLLEAAAVYPLVMRSSAMYSHVDGSLTLAVDGYDGSMLITTRDGQVLSAEWRTRSSVSYQQMRLLCGRHYVPGASFVVPPCTGVTTDALGLAIDFNNAELVDAEGQSHPRVVVNGMIRSNGL